MILKSLQIRNFRNYDYASLSFDQGIHLITGKNAQGKTNILEAIAYVSTTRSHRSSDDKDLIQEGKDSFVLDASIMKQQSSFDIRAAVNEQGKNLFYYRNPVKKVSDFIGLFNAVLFCPDDMTLFNASPRVRRRFIDMELSKVSKSYTKLLSESGRLLKERNAYLKQTHIDKTYLEVLTDRLIDQELIIMKQRNIFLNDVLKHCKSFYEDLSQDDTSLSFTYMSCVPYDEDIKVMRQSLKLKYDKSLERDCFLKQTTVGIHKEDFMFMINGKEIASYASQGQKRSVLLSMKIGIVYMIEQIIHEFPVLLLDDVFSELDDYRRKKLLTSLPQEVQIFITTTDVHEIPKIENRKYYHWMVEHGVITSLHGDEQSQGG